VAQLAPPTLGFLVPEHTPGEAQEVKNSAMQSRLANSMTNFIDRDAQTFNMEGLLDLQHDHDLDFTTTLKLVLC
jgi:hypothetical protein